MNKEMPRKSAPFWEMASLAMTGNLASCQSCVEFWYFQSKQNAVAFLDSCAAGGLVDRVSLIDLHGDLESVAIGGPTIRQNWYDQAIYISAPAFRKQNLDSARDKVEGTKNAVFEAFHLYFEILRGNYEAIDRAYVHAIRERKLRRWDVAQKRIDVDLSAVAKLRLIKDGFKYLIKNDNPALSRSQIDLLANNKTVDFILGYEEGEPLSIECLSDHSEELDQFIVEFLGSRADLPSFWQNDDGARFHFWLFPVVDELIRLRVATLREARDDRKLQTFSKTIRDSIHSAKKRERKNPAYLAAVEELVEDFESSFSSASIASSLLPQQFAESRI